MYVCRYVYTSKTFQAASLIIEELNHHWRLRLLLLSLSQDRTVWESEEGVEEERTGSVAGPRVGRRCGDRQRQAQPPPHHHHTPLLFVLNQPDCNYLGVQVSLDRQSLVQG